MSPEVGCRWTFRRDALLKLVVQLCKACLYTGRDIRLKDLAARTNGRKAARVVEWFVALKQGKDPVFPLKCEHVGQSFRLQQRHVSQTSSAALTCSGVGRTICLASELAVLLHLMQHSRLACRLS